MAHRLRNTVLMSQRLFFKSIWRRKQTSVINLYTRSYFKMTKLFSKFFCNLQFVISDIALIRDMPTGTQVSPSSDFLPKLRPICLQFLYLIDSCAVSGDSF